MQFLMMVWARVAVSLLITEADFGEGTDDGFVAFGGDGDDFAVGINDGDVFIGGRSRMQRLKKGFQDYTFKMALWQSILLL